MQGSPQIGRASARPAGARLYSRMNIKQVLEIFVEQARFLGERVAVLEAAGVSASRISVDPGFGFGKTVEQNYALLAHLPRTAPGGLPVLAGMSRKSMLGAVINKPATERLAASVAAAVLAVERGAKIVRVHDVAETVDALKVWRATRAAG